MIKRRKWLNYSMKSKLEKRNCWIRLKKPMRKRKIKEKSKNNWLLNWSKWKRNWWEETSSSNRLDCMTKSYMKPSKSCKSKNSKREDSTKSYRQRKSKWKISMRKTLRSNNKFSTDENSWLKLTTNLRLLINKITIFRNLWLKKDKS
jgi:hypothetical protein